MQQTIRARLREQASDALSFLLCDDTDVSHFSFFVGFSRARAWNAGVVGLREKKHKHLGVARQLRDVYPFDQLRGRLHRGRDLARIYVHGHGFRGEPSSRTHRIPLLNFYGKTKATAFFFFFAIFLYSFFSLSRITP